MLSVKSPSPPSKPVTTMRTGWPASRTTRTLDWPTPGARSSLQAGCSAGGRSQHPDGRIEGGPNGVQRVCPRLGRREAIDPLRRTGGHARGIVVRLAADGGPRDRLRERVVELVIRAENAGAGACLAERPSLARDAAIAAVEPAPCWSAQGIRRTSRRSPRDRRGRCKRRRRTAGQARSFDRTRRRSACRSSASTQAPSHWVRSPAQAQEPSTQTRPSAPIDVAIAAVPRVGLEVHASA